jgi:hypothetical protein
MERLSNEQLLTQCHKHPAIGDSTLRYQLTHTSQQYLILLGINLSLSTAISQTILRNL